MNMAVFNMVRYLIITHAVLAPMRVTVYLMRGIRTILKTLANNDKEPVTP